MALAQAMLRSFFRDRMALFFTFLFPLMFLVVFGLVFNGASPAARPRSASWAAARCCSSCPARCWSRRPTRTWTPGVAGREARGRRRRWSTQEGDRLVLRFAASDMVKSATIQGILRRSSTGPTWTPRDDRRAYCWTALRSRTSRCEPIQFIAGGMLSWGVATSATFGAALTIVSWRKKQLLRRVRLSPAPVWTVVAARVGVSIRPPIAPPLPPRVAVPVPPVSTRAAGPSTTLLIRDCAVLGEQCHGAAS